MRLYFAHATGFCAAVWGPVLAELPSRFEKIAWDFPGHGRGPALSRPLDWWDMGRFVLSQVEPGGVGVGHSMGGAALVMAEIMSPGTFAGLVLIEPVIFPPPYEPVEHPFVERAGRRRRSFRSRQAAWANFRDKRPFSTWHPQALAGYLDGGFRVEGDELLLACAPEDEAEFYRAATAHGVWDRLGEVRTPVLILASDERDEDSAGRFARDIASRLPRGGFEEVEGSTHYLPMEKPALVARRVERMAEALSRSEASPPDQGHRQEEPEDEMESGGGGQQRG